MAGLRPLREAKSKTMPVNLEELEAQLIGGFPQREGESTTQTLARWIGLAEKASLEYLPDIIAELRQARERLLLTGLAQKACEDEHEAFEVEERLDNTGKGPEHERLSILLEARRATAENSRIIWFKANWLVAMQTPEGEEQDAN